MLQLQTLLMDRARALLPREGEYALNKRQRVALASLQTELESAIRTDDYLILAEHLRAARGALDAITGRAGTEDMLDRSEEHTSELQSLMRISYAVFCLKK